MIELISGLVAVAALLAMLGADGPKESDPYERAMRHILDGDGRD